jgi:hypothetical protein
MRVLGTWPQNARTLTSRQLEEDIEELFIKVNESITNGSNKSVRIKVDKSGLLRRQLGASQAFLF